MKNLLLWATGAALAAAAVRYRAWPKQDGAGGVDVPDAYVISRRNRIDFQNGKACAAFSSAYVLRHLGVEADGDSLYRKFPRKLLDGTVDPKGILVLFRQSGYNARFCQGDVDTLKKQISRGTPVILFLKVSSDKRHLHFVPAVGYDREHIYLAESLKHKSNCDGSGYNRKLPVAELDSIWRTNFFYKRSYIVIEP
ncbi:cysteine peptidase family C39 domain-containing protein [Saccharibacillus alkalitolerans]|uniref:Peptidase C39-like domain-containing protein n=1 Tax=Saccharibacillus alkalitolerans TaxID=2705290 RepID=A0ABX0F7Y1_9BACL|nr:hypothetical protein [Saccharibacillus alkalitolerans]NGZ76952.1 hypothetical protein [Saccharibacillus alkalitolerans]